MSDLEARAAHLERELIAITEILEMRARDNESRFSAFFAEFESIKSALCGIQNGLKDLPLVMRREVS